MPMQQELPEQFGRYRIVKKLGAGGMGAVYLAEDAKLRRKVALKVPHFTAGTRGAGLERFQREARLAAGIEHPNFCPVHDVDEVDGIHFFTMTYLEGTPLADLIADEQPWPALQAVDMVRRVALAVGELHSRGIVHRDLKPANIMVRPSGEPVLMDFGLACSLTSQSERLTGTGEVLGTLAYMPPEQLEGDRARMGPAADVYSLGMILYELLTGQLPFSGPPLLVVAQVGGKVPEPPSTLQPVLDARLDAICHKALAKTPEERFPNTATFVAALEAFLRTPGGDGRTAATMPQPHPGPLSFRQDTIPPSSQKTVTRPPRRPLAGPRGLLVPMLLMVVGAAVWLGIHLWPPRDEGTPDPKPSLRLLELAAVKVTAGQTTKVPVKIKREDCPGLVEITLAKEVPGVKLLSGLVGKNSDEGSLELEVDKDAKGERILRLLQAKDETKTEGDLPLHILSVELPDKFVNKAKMQMVRIKNGTFKMGSPDGDKEKYDNEVAQHPVKITKDFYMGATEVTVGQFTQFVEEEKYKTEAETGGKGGWGYDECIASLGTGTCLRGS
jgi:serine/threonine protein kinase